MIKAILLFIILSILLISKSKGNKNWIKTLTQKINTSINNTGINNDTNTLMTKETTGINRDAFYINDELPYLGDFNSIPLPYKRYEINPLPEDKILDYRDKNLYQLKNEGCFGE